MNDLIQQLRDSFSVAELRPAALDPIMPLSPGHLGLALASGLLDGSLLLADGRQAVVRGVCDKEEYELSREDKKLGSSTVTTIKLAEKARLVIRVLDQNGNLEEYSN